MTAPDRRASLPMQAGWFLRDVVQAPSQFALLELWVHSRGPIGLTAIPRGRLMLAPHLVPWLLRNGARLLAVATARSGWESFDEPGPVVAPHALPTAWVLPAEDYDQAHAVEFGNAAAVGLDPHGARYGVRDCERALAYMRGVLDALTEPPPAGPWPGGVS